MKKFDGRWGIAFAGYFNKLIGNQIKLCFLKITDTHESHIRYNSSLDKLYNILILNNKNKASYDDVMLFVKYKLKITITYDIIIAICILNSLYPFSIFIKKGSYMIYIYNNYHDCMTMKYIIKNNIYHNCNINYQDARTTTRINFYSGYKENEYSFYHNIGYFEHLIMISNKHYFDSFLSISIYDSQSQKEDKELKNIMIENNKIIRQTINLYKISDGYKCNYEKDSHKLINVIGKQGKIPNKYIYTNLLSCIANYFNDIYKIKNKYDYDDHRLKPLKINVFNKYLKLGIIHNHKMVILNKKYMIKLFHILHNYNLSNELILIICKYF